MRSNSVRVKILVPTGATGGAVLGKSSRTGDEVDIFRVKSMPLGHFETILTVVPHYIAYDLKALAA